RFPNQAVHDRLDLVELLLVHHHSRVNHGKPPCFPAKRWQTFASAARQACSRPQAKGRCQVSPPRSAESAAPRPRGLFFRLGHVRRDTRGERVLSECISSARLMFSCFPFRRVRARREPVGLIPRHGGSRWLVPLLTAVLGLCVSAASGAPSPSPASASSASAVIPSATRPPSRPPPSAPSP